MCVSVKRDTTYITNAAQGRRHDPSHFWFQERWRRMWSDGHPGPNTRHVVYCRELAASTGGSQENRINPPPFRIFQCGASGFSVIRETFFFCFCLYWENVLKSGILKISSVKISSQTNSLLKTKLYWRCSKWFWGKALGCRVSFLTLWLGEKCDWWSQLIVFMLTKRR